ncbi:magnesium transporter CorA family protein [Synergistaceae bacterium OttesenSCG-928-D05]|nr:magnesium transporter CorA family protein [Synergistaceae bacterium OttesenSCG-928-D05]
MLKIVRNTEHGWAELDTRTAAPGVWLNLVAPSEDEMAEVERITGVPQDFLRAALDPEEPSRTEISDGQFLVLINVPVDRKTDVNTYDTLPLGMIVTPDYFVTVSCEESPALQYFNAERADAFCTAKRAKFLFQILYKSAALYLHELRQISRASEKMEQDLRASMRNKELFALLDLQKGLTYFSIASRSNKVVIERLIRLTTEAHGARFAKLDEEEMDLLDDVRVEYDQAVEMAQIQTEVLSSMVDAFASVISNNLNVVMKFLASVTVVMSIPTIIASYFGMNVPVPWTAHPFGFWMIIAFTFVLAVLATITLWKRNLF